MTGALDSNFPVAVLDGIWHPPAGGRRLFDPKAAVRVPSGGWTVAAARAQLQRLVNRAPQVMVKVSGRQRGGDHVSAHFEYIGRHGELDVETEDGETLKDVAALRERAAEWHDEDDSDRANAVTSISMVLSMPAGTDALKVLAAARAFARIELDGKHRYMFALHDDTDHPHVHLTVAVAPCEAEGDRFNPRKADLHRMRETFAHELRERGIEADATPRRARGIVRRSDNVPLRKLKERYGRTGGLVDADERARCAGVVFAEGQSDLTPWEQAGVSRQAQVKVAYGRVARQLETLSDPADRQLGAALRRFVDAMPPPLSRRMLHAIAYLEQVKAQEGSGAVAKKELFKPSATRSPSKETGPIAPPPSISRSPRDRQR
ncbi:relaxase/mobilization nuclease domain-containing protein [Rhizorhabdus argentea]|uniref:relaxase/mobilization nuclease domain-containing protein n=1 Tax=Rhizorhabdus argentea TaxID=1387174 RepID=UPI0030EC5B42